MKDTNRQIHQDKTQIDKIDKTKRQYIPLEPLTLPALGLLVGGNSSLPPTYRFQNSSLPGTY